VSSHDLSELEQVCDWLVLIEAGRTLYQGPTHELLDGQFGGLAVAAGRDSEQVILDHALRSAGHRVRAEDHRLVVDVDGTDIATLAASVNRQAFDAGIVLVELSPIRTSLEDRYLTMINGGSR
jgi:ABC-2 type transport system ATP-binding protein